MEKKKDWQVYSPQTNINALKVDTTMKYLDLNKLSLLVTARGKNTHHGETEGALVRGCFRGF